MLPDWNAIAGVTKTANSSFARLSEEAEWIVQDVKLSLEEIAATVSEIEHIQQGLKK